MLPTELSGMSWLRSQIAAVMDSVAAAAEEWQLDIILANQLAYGQVGQHSSSCKPAGCSCSCAQSLTLLFYAEPLQDS
jgi:hypothetical protein